MRTAVLNPAVLALHDPGRPVFKRAAEKIVTAVQEEISNSPAPEVEARHIRNSLGWVDADVRRGSPAARILSGANLQINELVKNRRATLRTEKVVGKGRASSADVRARPEVYVQRLCELEFSEDVAKRIVEQRPVMVAAVLNGAWRASDKDFADNNGRCLSLTADTMLEGTKAVTVYRGLELDDVRELVLKLPVDHLLQPVVMSYPEFSFLTDDCGYALDVYAGGAGGVVIEYELFPTLLHKGENSDSFFGDRIEYVLDNESVFRRRANPEVDIFPALRRQGESEEEIQSYRDGSHMDLSAVYDQTPFISNIYLVETDEDLTLEEFQERFFEA